MYARDVSQNHNALALCNLHRQRGRVIEVMGLQLIELYLQGLDALAVACAASKIADNTRYDEVSGMMRFTCF